MHDRARAVKGSLESQNAMAAKAAMRRRVKAAVAELTPEQRGVASQQAGQRLIRQSVWEKARSILFFAPTQDEVDIWPLLERALAEKKVAALPRYVKDDTAYAACQVCDLRKDITLGRFNLREPGAACAQVPLNRLDLILVPGVAFDLHGRRLGRGKGFYDQMLKTVRGIMCGVAFDEQIVCEVPVEPHDIHLNCLLTPTRWIEL